MIIDSHLHLRDDRFVAAEGTPENIIALMDQAGIDRSVVFKIWCSTESSIRAGQEAAEKFADRLIPYVYAVPGYERPVARDLEEALSEKGFRGVKLHAGDCSLAEYVVDPVLALAGRHDVPCLIDFCGRHAAAERILRQFPKTKIIIAHLGAYLSTDEQLIDGFIDLGAGHDNAYLDVSGVVLPLKIKDAVTKAGSRKVLWGTDGPRRAPDTLAFMRTELDKVRSLGLSDSQQQDVLGGTIARLLQM